MTKFFIFIILSFTFLDSCKNDFNSGMEYQKILLAKKGETSIYCYCLVWALDAEAYYISYNQDVCSGFDSTKDYCFGRGNQVIYYKFENDTLSVYCYGSRPSIPKVNLINVKLINLEFVTVDEYENKFKNKEMHKIILDSFQKIPCKIVAPPIDLLNVRFESKN